VSSGSRFDVRERRCAAIRAAIDALVQQGRKVSFPAVAQIVGIKPSTIHNCYKVEAIEIRRRAGLKSVPEVERLRQEIAELVSANQGHVKTIDDLRRDVARLASVNEALRRQRAIDIGVATGKVTRLRE
jgi:hypothetical protein